MKKKKAAAPPTPIERQEALKQRLMDISAREEKLVGQGAILAAPGHYLSGFPYMGSTDIDRAFRFKDVAQAKALQKEFPSLLTKYRPVSVSPEPAAIDFVVGLSAEVNVRAKSREEAGKHALALARQGELVWTCDVRCKSGGLL